MARPWMPLYIADYLQDTAHLSTAEHGAYLLLIMFYWAKGGLPRDEESIRRITRMSNRQWSQSRDVLRSFFGDEWRHERIDHELSQAIEKSRVNSANAQRSHSDRRANAQRSQTQPQSHTQIEPSSLRSDGARAPEPPPDAGTDPPAKAKRDRPRCRLPDDWQPDTGYAAEHGIDPSLIPRIAEAFRNHHRAKGSMMADWTAAWRTWIGNEKRFTAARAPPVAGTMRNVTPFQRARAETQEILAQLDAFSDGISSSSQTTDRVLPAGDGNGSAVVHGRHGGAVRALPAAPARESG